MSSQLNKAKDKSMTSISDALWFRGNNLKQWAKLPKECAYCDLHEEDWTCSVCLDDASPTYCLNETNEVICLDSTMTHVMTSCGHRFHIQCLENYTTIKTNGDCVGVIPCPNCRNAVFVDKRNNAKMFEWWISCDCCERHMTNRPTTYAYDEDIDNSCKSLCEEEAESVLSDEDYKLWRKMNAKRRAMDVGYCACNCRHEARIAIRRIPPP